MRIGPTSTVLLLVMTAAGARADACRDAALATIPAAEQLCSDAIARLSYGTGTDDQADRLPLASAYNNRAMARTAAGNLSGAAEDLGQALSLSGEHWAILVNRGNLRLAENQPQAALADYARAQSLAPAAADAVRRNAVLAYLALGDLDRARASLMAAQGGSRTAARNGGAPAARRR